ncbi:phosphotransferase system cellobiose-specific component IIA [Thermanaerovibrio velox DSM 12556]|uniref:PTS system lactose-specific EIIA component n=1 Tax=Thermanaerovibrio velox DSM 12556 TaxID=926567 RepID=H0UPE7_9BACT|nr:PTS lactose/cellobiose transporter subunit IIA [Thermanaerovibrio velox]EHM10578.1 phosphotransferase system cellobiose-specific component IIA [Thermanaerovibrio velox DSM 12556]
MGEDEKAVFKIISMAGDAFSRMMEAAACARGGDFSGALERMEQAEALIVEAHKVQTSLLVGEARGDQVNVTMLMVHAQDHLMNAMLAKPLVGEIINLYQVIHDGRVSG